MLSGSPLELPMSTGEVRSGTANLNSTKRMFKKRLRSVIAAPPVGRKGVIDVEFVTRSSHLVEGRVHLLGEVPEGNPSVGKRIRAVDRYTTVGAM